MNKIDDKNFLFNISSEHLRISLIETIAHVVGWSMVFGLPYILMSRSGIDVPPEHFLQHGLVAQLAFLIVFYANYFCFSPRFLFVAHYKRFIFANLLLISVMTIVLHLWHTITLPPMANVESGAMQSGPPRVLFIVRDAFYMTMTVCVSVAIKMSGRFAKLNLHHKEAEKRRAEAELKNLRNQLNPHFLLNTLNNIYALIAFDADKAQTAVSELSKLLRHLLYDNQEEFVPIGKEVDFIRNYIELMRIRLTDNVSVVTEYNVSADSRTIIAPLIFISLIENAFKHGISPTEASYINIRISDDNGVVTCETTNSNHPKTHSDKSGNGIGLEQVQRRLDLSYPDKYRWSRGVSESGLAYTSSIVIDTRKK